MKIYIASPYVKYNHINNQIVDTLKKEIIGIEVFLPKSINVDAVSLSEMEYVANICYKEIDDSELLVVVGPFGQSVAAEIGYAIANRRNRDTKIILYSLQEYDKSEKETMIAPFIDYKVQSVPELIEIVKKLLPKKKRLYAVMG